MTRRLQPAGTVMLGAGVLLAAIMVAAFAIADDLAIGLACAGIVLVYAAIVAFGRSRGGTLEALSGAGDERTDLIYLRALAFAGTAVIVAILAWWVVQIATGGETTILTALGALYGAAFIGACAVLQRRS